MEVVESPRLAEFLHRINPEYRLPSQDEVQRLCDFKISLRKAQLTDQLKSVPSLCLSQEVWKHSDVNLLYLTLTCHYIEGWCYKHVLLSGATVSADVLQDKSKMAELQQAVLSQYSLESRVLVTVNNLGNNFPLPGFLSPGGVAKSLPVSVSLGQSGYAFLLGKAVTQSITDCGENLLEAISQAAALAESAGIKPGHSIPQTKQESWVEHLSLIDLVLQTPREKFLADSPDRLLQPDQILLLTNMVEVLRPFQEVAKRVQNTRSISCSLAFASIRLLKAALLDLKEAYSECRLVDELAKNYQMVTADIDDNNKANAYTIATILDPRFKLQWCDNANQNDLKKSMIQLAKGERLSEGGASDESIKPESIQSGFFTRILKQPPESVQAGTIASEVLRYLDEPLMMEDCDIMSYWQANDTNFPHLSGLAQKYLAIPTSYADVEGFYHLKGETMSISSTSVKGDSFLKAVQLRCSLA